MVCPDWSKVTIVPSPLSGVSSARPDRQGGNMSLIDPDKFKGDELAALEDLDGMLDGLSEDQAAVAVYARRELKPATFRRVEGALREIKLAIHVAAAALIELADELYPD